MWGRMASGAAIGDRRRLSYGQPPYRGAELRPNEADILVPAGRLAPSPDSALVYTSGLPYNENHEEPKSGGEETAHAVYQESRRPSFS